jgi:ketosteroid isomerase-like protein
MSPKIPTSLAAATAAILSISTPLQAEGTSDMTADEKDVLALIQSMTSSFEKGDIDAVMQTYEPSQSIAFQPGEPVSDSTLSRQMFEQFRAISPEFSYSGHEVIVEGDIAVHVAPWQMTGTDPEGKAVTGSGLSIAVLRRQSDGSWKMVIDNPHGSRLLPAAR